MYNNFGPAYRTTANDRAARGQDRLLQHDSLGAVLQPERQADVMLGGGEGTSHADHMSFPHANVTSSLQQAMGGGVVGVSQPSAVQASSTRNNASQLGHPPRSPSPVASLIDFDNSVLESWVTHHGPGLPIDINQRSPAERVSDVLGNSMFSNSSQYANVNQSTFRRTIHFIEPNMPPQPRPVVRGDDPRTAPHLSVHTQGLNREVELGKTDRIVVMELIKDLRSVSGADERDLIRFLKTLRPIFEVAPMCSTEVIKLITPKVTGQLFQIWIEAVSARVNWETLHCKILDYFLPPLRLRELHLSEIERPQRREEQFVEYVEDVIASAFALRANLSEREVIDSVLSKCAPNTRSHFSFDFRPSTICELRNLAGRVSSSVNAERRYFGVGASHLYGERSRPSPPRNHPAPAPATRSQQYGASRGQNSNNVTCHRCGRVGHIARNCRESLN